MDSARAAVRTLTPPLDRRTAGDVGRRARLELVFARQDGRTALAHGYAEPPLRVGRWFPDGEGAHMILASSSPGIFGGDAFEQTIIVEPHAEVRLTSQSALQLHPSSCASLAWIRSVYRVGEGGRLHCHWDPLIPFGGARLNQQIVIELARGARLHWSDSIMNGRRARGEQWRFSSLAHELKVFRTGVLQYLERYRIAPEEGRCDRHWVAGEASHFGTTLVSLADIAPGETERLHAELAGIAGVQAAADALNEGLLVVRLMATSGAAFREARALVDRWQARAYPG